MKFDIIITHIGNPKAKNIIAHHLAHDPSISLQKAMSMLENPPVVYMTSVLKDDAQYHMRQLEKIQVTAKLVEVQLAPFLPHAAAPFVPEHGAPLPQQSAQPAQQVSPAAAQPVRPAARSIAEPVEPPADTPTPGVSEPGSGMTKSKIIAITSISAALLVITFTILALRGTFNWGHAFTLDWSKSGIVSGDNPSKQANAKKPKTGRGKQDPADKKNGGDGSLGNDSAEDQATEEQKSKAEACVDSGKKAPDISEAISFYQLAIAFNKRNVNAWYALHDAYVSAQMSNEAEKTNKAMRQLFGDNIFSIAKIMEPFGSATSTSLTRDGIYRVEYQARESDPAKNLADSYLLVKALRSSCLCNALSLYARTSAGKGMLVYIRTESFPASFDEFKASANITYLK
jgi:hypothetical protein